MNLIGGWQPFATINSALTDGEQESFTPFVHTVI